MSESGHSLFLYNIPKDVVLWVVFFSISSKIGKRHLRIKRWIGKWREGVFMIPLWIWIIAALLVVGIAVAALLSSYENKRLTVEYYEIGSEKIPEAFDGYRIVFLTDLHCAQFGENNQELIERIDECRPGYDPGWRRYGNKPRIFE